MSKIYPPNACPVHGVYMCPVCVITWGPNGEPLWVDNRVRPVIADEMSTGPGGTAKMPGVEPTTTNVPPWEPSPAEQTQVMQPVKPSQREPLQPSAMSYVWDVTDLDADMWDDISGWIYDRMAAGRRIAGFHYNGMSLKVDLS